MIIRSSVLSQYGTPDPVAIVDNFLNAAPDGLSKFATAIILLGKYLLLTIVPYQLVSDYSFNQIPIVGVTNWMFLLSLVIHILLVVYIIKNIRKKSPLIFGLIFYFVTISIYSNLAFSIGSSFAERFMFLPTLGFSIAVVFLLIKVLKINSEKTTTKILTWMKSSSVLMVVIGLIVVLYSTKTVVRAAEWKDQYTLFGSDIKKSPNSAHLHYYWGLTLRDKAMENQDNNGQKEMMMRAIAEFDKAVSIYPSYPDCYEQLGLAWYRVKDNTKAMENYQKALQLNNTKAVTWSNLGIIYFEQGDYKKSLELYTKALSLDSNYADGYFNMGSTLGMLGRFDEAISSFKKCIFYDPENAKAHEFIGLTYKNLHREAEAKPWFDKAAILEQKKSQEKKIK
jgi:Flp pilus assembly protein TadD